MKRLFFMIICVFAFTNIFSQNNVKDLINQGITLHDEGKYNEAIEMYKAAIAMDEKSSTAHYELAYTYLTIKEFDEAIKQCKVVIKLNSGSLEEAYSVLGTCYDLTGKPSKAIKTYEKGIAKLPGYYLLHFNLGLTCFNQQEYDKAEEASIKAITINPMHASSHMLLSSVMKKKGSKVKSILPLYYFLMLEPDTQRSLNCYKSLIEQLGQGVEKKGTNLNTITLPSNSDPFGPAELAIGIVLASKYTEQIEDKNELELFAMITKSIFSMLGELKKDNTGLWWDLYVDTFYNLVETDNWEAYSYYISISTENELIGTWFSENEDKMQKFANWMGE